MNAAVVIGLRHPFCGREVVDIPHVGGLLVEMGIAHGPEDLVAALAGEGIGIARLRNRQIVEVVSFRVHVMGES